ncbi:DMT family transporter [Palleronia caenipelagi]|uniref:DMT family transporter n=1 Tax=Palleronia caenipelagi TaxID=2489174 RepID=A0A547PJ64_9RHOB|nr:DMT family transporter [Palleronia caenipelagi]TRD14169.1 DMT family transporter [Palleronia caenipelagi]
MTRSETYGIILVLIAALSWSTAGLFTRVVNTDIPTTLLWRSVFGGFVVMAIYYFLQEKKSIAGLFRFSKGEIVIAVVSAIAMSCFISAFFYTTIANVSFIYGAVPLVTMLLAWALLKDYPSKTGVFASLISASGIFILAWGGQDFSDYVGLLLAFLMTFFMASITVLAKYFPSANASKCAYLSAFIAAIFVFPFSEGVSVAAVDMTWLAVYGVINVGLGFGVYLLGVSRVSALAAALVGLSEIPLAPIWAFALFGEAITGATILGGIMILSASIIYIMRSSNTNKSNS